LAGSWLIAVAGFGGMRDHGDTLHFAPRLPARLTRMSFRLLYRDRRLCVTVSPSDAHYELLDGEALALRHHGEDFTLQPGTPRVLRLPPAPQRTRPAQPPGRSPPLGA
jgi:alpha,alpha-trehalose phosphorylase